jgi:hypothetical protein
MEVPICSPIFLYKTYTRVEILMFLEDFSYSVLNRENITVNMSKSFDYFDTFDPLSIIHHCSERGDDFRSNCVTDGYYRLCVVTA